MVETICSGIEDLDSAGMPVKVIHSGTGNISKTDLLMAETSGNLVI